MNLGAEMPQLASTAYASNSVNLNAVGQLGQWMNAARPTQQIFDEAEMRRQLQQFAAHVKPPTQKAQEAIPMSTASRRLVQVFIADPDENVPLSDCLLYSGEQKLTDLTDQELFFEVDIKTILDQHNAKRVALVNKTVKERTEHMEPARIRDLKMTVVTIASF